MTNIFEQNIFVSPKQLKLLILQCSNSYIYVTVATFDLRLNVFISEWDGFIKRNCFETEALRCKSLSLSVMNETIIVKVIELQCAFLELSPDRISVAQVKHCVVNGLKKS